MVAAGRCCLVGASQLVADCVGASQSIGRETLVAAPSIFAVAGPCFNGLA